MNKNEMYFSECPMCTTSNVKSQFYSLEKDMSLGGFKYNKCQKCSSVYAADGTTRQLNEFYKSLEPYTSTSAKDSLVKCIVDDFKIDASKRILDVGCGSGAWALPILKFCKEITCVDLDSGAVESLKNSVPAKYKHKVKCITADNDKFLAENKEEKYDMVLSMFSFEHQLEPKKFLVQLSQVLAPEGKILILIPSGDALQLKVLKNGFYWAQAPWHTVLPTHEGMRLIAESVGFSKVEVYQPRERFYSWFWIRGLFDKLRLRSIYNLLRRYRVFIRIDIALDEFFDRLSFRLNKPSYRFYVLTKK